MIMNNLYKVLINPTFSQYRAILYVLFFLASLQNNLLP